MIPIKKVFLIPLFMLLVLGLGLVFLPISTFNPDSYQGNKLIQGENKHLAFKFYQSAEKSWPLLKFNWPFRKNYDESIRIRGEYLQSRPAVIVFFKDSASESEILTLREDIGELDNVSDVKYVSQEDALKIYQDRNKANPELLSLVTAEILPASLEVFLINWERQNEIRDITKENPNVDDVIVLPSY